MEAIIMSEYAGIRIKSLELCSFRNYLDKEIVSLFFSDECLFIKENVKYDQNDDEEKPHTQYIYKTIVKNAKQRLDVLGYTISRFKTLFTKTGAEFIDFNSYLCKTNVDFNDYEKIEKQLYENHINFDKWVESLRKIINYELTNGNIGNSYNKEITMKLDNICDEIIMSTITNYTSETKYSYSLNISDNDLPFLLRQILEFCDENESIELDFSNLQFWSVDYINNPINLNNANEKTIVLLEGTSDKDILEFSMKILYPHLQDLIYFMDFDSQSGIKRDGGSSFLVKKHEDVLLFKTQIEDSGDI